MSFVIEKGIPMPSMQSAAGKVNFRAVLRSMEIGDSVVLPFASLDTARATCSQIKKGFGGKRTFRAMNVNGAIRVWRTA